MTSFIISTSAKQWRLPERTGIDSLKLVDFEVPKPGVDEVLVKLEAGSLQYRDLMIVNGKYPTPVRDNVIPGSDGAGTVVAVGPMRYAQKKSWVIGDRVAGQFTQLLETGELRTEEVRSSALGGGWDGVFTQYRVFPSSGLVKIPDALSFEEAATLPCAALTAYNSLYGSTHILRAGEWVLALGTGGVSIFAMQFALSSGAHCIITSSSDAKLQKAREIAGEHASRLHLINYSKTPNWEVEVRKIVTRGVDFVVEVGGNATLPRSFKSVAIGGMIASVGFVGQARGGEPLPDINGQAINSASNLRGIFIGSRTQFEQMNEHIAATGLKPFVDKVFEFEEMKEAYKYLESQKHVGKVVVRLA